ASLSWNGCLKIESEKLNHSVLTRCICLLPQNIEQLQDRLVEKSNRLTVVRRECHRRRLLLLAQQQLMDSGPQSYHRCMYCAKAFLNASFLAAHVHRRHPETEVTKPTEDNRILTMTQQTSEQQQRQQQHQTFSLETAQVQNNNTQTTSLEREVRELLVQLKSFNGRRSPSNPVMFMKPSEISVPVQPADTNKTDEEEPSKPDWQTLMIEEHRRDMELLRNMFEKELRALQIQHATTQDELAQLKVKRVASNLGELVDDVPTVRNEQLTGPISIKQMSPLKEVKLSDSAISKLKTSEEVSPNVTADFVQTNNQIKQSQDAVDHSVQTQNAVTGQNTLPSNSSISVQLLDNQHPGWPVRRRPTRNHSLEPPIRNPSDNDDDEDDNAESDITYQVDPTPGRNDNVRFRRLIRSRNVGSQRNEPVPESDFSCYDEIDGNPCTRYGTRRKYKRKHRHKRVRSAAIQVGHGRHRSELQTNVAVASLSGDEPVFLRIRRPYSRSGSSASIHKSCSPGTRRVRAASLDGRSREIVIVRTEDEDGSGDRRSYETGSERSSLRSVHLMPTPKILGPRSTIQRERIIHVGASARSSLPEHNTSSTKAIPVFDEPTLSASKASIGTEARTISEHVSKRSASSPQRSNAASRSEMRTISDRRALSQSPLRASTSQVAETDDTADESDNQQVSRAMGHILTVSEASSPVQSVNMSTNVLRYSRLLDQLKSDPETLRGLRHEVEQLLMEQLAERGIEANETRLTTTALNDRLLILRRERENIARKHPDFFEIREALAQYVDRLANAMLHGKNVQRTSSSEIRPVPSRLQRASVIARSGLPPPAMHSPVGARKGGTLPIQASRRAEVGSGLGSSMPILGQHDLISKTGKPQSSPLANFDTSKPYFQRSSPHLQFGETHPDELHSSRSGMSTASPRHRSELGTPPVGRSQLPSQAETPSPRKARGSPQRSRSTASPYRTPERSSALKSPSIQLSHDQRVITFNRPEVSNNPVAPTSSDEWDSEPDEPPITTNKSVDPRMNQLKMPHSMSKVPDVLGTGVDLDEADRFLNDLGERQRNSNALFNQDNPVRRPIPMTLNRAHSVRTDDEDICSVSSLNGGVADDTSLSLVPGTPTRKRSKVSRSLDPGVVAAKAQVASTWAQAGDSIWSVIT
ncbi:Iguana/Dzip1 protein, partial [Fasciola gigantica]